MSYSYWKWFPTRIKVGHLHYKIERWNATAATGAGRCGECAHHEGVIRIAEHLRPSHAVETLLHELIHAIWYSWNIPNEGASEEQVAASVAIGITTVMADNPELSRLLQKTLSIRP